MRLPLERCRLYTFIDTAYLGGRAPVEVAKQLCDGGSDLVQLRAKGAPADEVRRLAEEIQPVLQQAGVGLVINDHWEVARQVGADFCHLGQEDFFDKGLTHASQLPRGPLLGLSTHRPEQALRSIAARPAYIAIGPVYATPTKPAATAVTLDYVRWAAENVRIPWFAIGGIHLRNIRQVMEAGATRICAVSAILNAADPAEACRQFKRQLAMAQ